MVIKQFFGALALLLISLTATAAPALTLQLNNTELQLGHYLDAELYGINLSSSLSDAPLYDLDESFFVSIEETSQLDDDPRWPHQHIQLMRLKLYPRTEGELVVPALSFAGATSTPTTVLVKPGILKTRSGESNIEHTVTVSTPHPWERQQVLITAEITTADTFVSLQSGDFSSPDVESVTLPASNTSIERNGTKYSVLKTGWVLFPLTKGQHTIELPAIEYRKSGRVLRTYHLPRQVITVKALPSYIPPTMPVGRINISSSLPSGTLFTPGTLSLWNITLTGTGVSPNWMPSISRQLHTDPDTQFFPATIERSSTALGTTLQSQVNYTIPFKANSNGQLKLPTLHAQYFDPDSGKIIRTTHPAPRAFVISTTWRILAEGLCGLILLWFSHTLYKKLRAFHQRQQLIKTALGILATATNTTEIRKGLNTFSRANAWPNNMTLREWSRYWLQLLTQRQPQHQQPHTMASLIEELSRACYGKSEKTRFAEASNRAEFTKLRDALLSQLKSR